MCCANRIFSISLLLNLYCLIKKYRKPGNKINYFLYLININTNSEIILNSNIKNILNYINNV